MPSTPPHHLQALYERHSQREYEEQLAQIVDSIGAVLRSLSVRCQIKHRVKSFDEYHRKWSALGGTDSTPIGDMLGVRIVCPFLDDVRVVERALGKQLSIVEIDRKGEQRSFSEFGYDSTHLVLDLHRETVAHPLPGVAPVCEIQIRTILQDAWAEVEHELIYKSEWSIPTDQIRRKLAALNANLSLSDLIFQELRDLQNEVRRKQERRRELQAVSAQLEPSLESRAVGQRLDTAALDEIQRLDLDQLVLRALTAHAEGAFGAAIQLYSLVLTRPGATSIRSIILNHRGMAFFALGENHAAKLDFESAVAADASQHRPWYNLGLAHRALGDGGRAREAFAHCCRLDPASGDARAQYVRALIDEPDLATAQRELATLTSDHPAHPELADLRAALAALSSRAG